MFHQTVLDAELNWDHVRSMLIGPNTNQFAIAQNGIPVGVPPQKWAHNLKHDAGFGRAQADGFSPAIDKVQFGYRAGYYLAQDVVATLVTGVHGTPPQRAGRVFIDEIKAPAAHPAPTAGSMEAVYYAAWYLGTYHPTLNGQWAVTIPHGVYVDYNAAWPAIYWSLAANAPIVVQCYFNVVLYRGKRTEYGSDAGADWYMRLWLVGGRGAGHPVPHDGYAWLEFQRAHFGSGSPLVPFLTVSDNAHVDSNVSPAREMMDRTIWNFKTSGLAFNPAQGYGENVRASRGGVGSWKWARLDQTGGQNTTSRDLYFSDAWGHYLADTTWAQHSQPRFRVP